MSSVRIRPLTLVLLAACSAPGPAADDSGGSSSSSASTTAPVDTTTTDTVPTSDPGTTTTGATDSSTTDVAEPALTYYRDIKSILDSKCANCHSPGNIAPFSITSYDEAKTMAPVIAPSVVDRSMPPWPPDAACADYRHARSLTEEQRTQILDWIDLGTPEGDPNDEPPTAGDDAPPIAYDIELGLPEPFVPTTLPDDYYCFLLDWPKQQDTYVTGFTVEPGARAMVHHVIAFLIPPDEVATYDALDAADPGSGYPCYGGPGGEASPRARWLGFWVPGGDSGALPEGTGIRVEPGSKIALQMHYHPLGDDTSDQSLLKIRTATEVARPAYLLPFANPGWMVDSPEMTIPARNSDVVHEFQIGLGPVIGYLYGNGEPGIGVPLQAHAAGVHMHTRGVRASLTVERPNKDLEDPCLVDVKQWDFNWQGTYELDQPITIETTDQVKLQCHFDNSASDTPLKWGEGTGDEMCLGMIYVSTPG